MSVKSTSGYAGLAAIIAVVALATTPASAADLLSGDVSITNNSPTLSSIAGGPVSGPTSAGINVNGFQFDFTGNTITYTDGYTGSYTSVGPGGFNGFVLTFSGVPAISGVSLDPTSQQAPVLSSNANQVFLEFNGGNQVQGQTALIDVSFGNAVSAAPEPATWATMLFGIGGIGAAMRNQRRKQLAAAAAA